MANKWGKANKCFFKGGKESEKKEKEAKGARQIKK